MILTCRFQTFVFLFAITFLIPQTALFSAEDDVTRNRFRKFVKERTGRLSFVSSPISFEQITTITGLTDGEFVATPTFCKKDSLPSKKGLATTAVELKANGQLFPDHWEKLFFEGSFLDSPKFEVVVLYNDQYHAMLKLMPQSQVALTSLKRGAEENAIPFSEFIGTTQIRSFDEISADPVVEMLDWTDLQHEGIDAKKLVFRDFYPYANAVVLFTAIFAIDDGRCLTWTCSSDDRPGDAICEANFEYTNTNGTFVPKRSQIDFFGRGYKRIECYRNVVFANNLNSDQFLVSHYGLPEPDWYTRPRPKWVYFSIAGIAMVLVGAFLFRIGKRKIQR